MVINCTQDCLVRAESMSESYDYLRMVYIIICFFSFFGNCLVCVIIFTIKRIHLLSAEVFILSLAITDMFTSIVVIFLPGLIISEKSYPYPIRSVMPFFCSIVSSQYLLFYFGFISLYTVTAISLERWFAIAFPSRYRYLFSLKNVQIAVLFIWLLGLLLPIDNLFKQVPSENGTFCRWTFLFNDINIDRMIFIIVEIIRVFLPAFITLFCYADIARRIWSASAYQSQESSNRNSKFRKRVTIMVCVSAITFLLCWLPNEIYFTLVTFGLTRVESVAHRSTKSLIILSSCLNPIIYVVTNSKYRVTLLQFFTRRNRISSLGTKQGSKPSKPKSDVIVVKPRNGPTSYSRLHNTAV
ncbi:Galanin receptor type 2 [Trichoplax sp. H2]|nr:Galanin receptor type 2 [Trichoplax sp. H2]|eukprot:RDD39096.1 Galanin receptor type 2 [Trichoplax sp. H2]